MKRKLITTLLTLVFCLTAVFPIAAAQPTAKDLVLAAAKNIDLGINEGFYEKSKGDGNFEITKFNGSLKEELGDLSGAQFGFYVEYDDSQNAMKLSYDTDIKDIVRDGDIYLQDDQVILTKDFFYLLQDFGFDVFEEINVSPSDVPEYLYLDNPQLRTTWEQMASYQNQQLPEEYTELLLFIVEAIPDEYFSLSTSKVTIKLDKAGLEETIVNLMTKMANESERVADIVISLNKYNFEQMGMDREEVKQELVSGMEGMTVPTREQVQAITSFIELNDFTFEYALKPGGPKSFNVDMDFNIPQSSITPDAYVNGSLNFAMDIEGKQDNLESSYRLGCQFNNPNGLAVDLTYGANSSYTDTVGLSDMAIDVTSKDNKTGELILDLALTGDSVTEIDTGLVLNVPELTPENSLDLTEFVPTTGASVAIEAPRERDLSLVVNGVALEAKPAAGNHGEIMVPARAALEQLGCQVVWIEPNELQVFTGKKTISLFMDQNSFTVNDIEKNLNTAPGLEAGSAMLPLSFITTELDTQIRIEGNVLTINR
ncbi:MAG: copper amine oxidase N-terminal domain-containing protein [Firmicutes bacterium]|nr:copper amine oxidase N-terminal domain-containing protein [Bacillota bacterium]